MPSNHDQLTLTSRAEKELVADSRVAVFKVTVGSWAVSSGIRSLCKTNILDWYKNWTDIELTIKTYGAQDGQCSRRWKGNRIGLHRHLVLGQQRPNHPGKASRSVRSCYIRSNDRTGCYRRSCRFSPDSHFQPVVRRLEEKIEKTQLLKDGKEKFRNGLNIKVDRRSSHKSNEWKLTRLVYPLMQCVCRYSR